MTLTSGWQSIGYIDETSWFIAGQMTKTATRAVLAREEAQMTEGLMERTRVRPESTPATRLIEAETGYFDVAWRDTDYMLDQAETALADVDFDTFVVTGLSGATVGLLFAHRFEKNLLVVRKEDDTSTHSGRRELGALGDRWLFLDDFVSTGRTQRRVVEHVENLVAWENEKRGRADLYEWENAYGKAPATSKYVGTYSYARGTLDLGPVKFADGL